MDTTSGDPVWNSDIFIMFYVTKHMTRICGIYF